MGKIFRRVVATLLIVTCVLTAANVCAAVQTFDGCGEWQIFDDENESVAKARAKQRAKLDAQKKAEVYMQTLLRSELTDDEISAIANNTIEIDGDVQYDRKIIPLSDKQTTILYTATLKTKIDIDEGVYNWLVYKDKKNKVTIVHQNKELQDAVKKNDELAENLQEQYRRATTQVERDQIRKQMNDADRDFSAIQKNQEGINLYYTCDYYEAIELFNEALTFGEYASVYNNRGLINSLFGEYEQAIADFNKAIELNPNYSDAYHNLSEPYYRIGLGYNWDGKFDKDYNAYEQAIQYLDKAIEFDPESFDAYCIRGDSYYALGQYEQAIEDFNKAIEIYKEGFWSNGDFTAYNRRGIAYYALGQYERAIEDFTKYIEIFSEYFDGYYNRGLTYYRLKQYARAIEDFNKAIEFNPNYYKPYKIRGLAYNALGQHERAVADFRKAFALNQ